MNIDTLHGIINAVERVRLCKQELHNAQRHLDTINIQCDHRYPNKTDACYGSVKADGSRTCLICGQDTKSTTPPKPKLPAFTGQPVIAVDRRAGTLAIFDDFQMVQEHTQFMHEAEAVIEAKVRIAEVTDKVPEVQYPKITKMTMRS